MSVETVKIKLINLALGLIGSPPITQELDLGTTNSAIVNAAFDYEFNDAMTKDQWRFTAVQAQLSRVNETPIIPDYLYTFLLPPNILKIIRVYPINDYSIYGSKLVSNLKNLWIEYQENKLIEQTPDYFRNYLVMCLAKHFSFAIAKNDKYVQTFTREKEVARAEAIYCDAQNYPNKSWVDNKYVQVRYY
jgi:hypothetical protein